MGKKRSPLVYIIILNWNGRDDTIECLNSLNQLDYPNYIIIIVDNSSNDGLVDVVQEQFPESVLIKNEENVGFAEGNNIGIRYALSQQCDYVLLLNNDTVLEPSFLSKLITVGEEYPEIGMLSPFIYWHHLPEKIWFCRGEISWENGSVNQSNIEGHFAGRGSLGSNKKNRDDELDYVDNSDYLSGCALLVKSQILRQIGLLDKRFFAYYEDLDWCIRCKQAGWKLAVVPSAKIWHKVNAAATHLTNFLLYRNTVLFLWKHSTFFRFLLRLKHHIYRGLAEYSWDKERYHLSDELNPLDGIWAGICGKYDNYQQKMPMWAQKFSYRYIRYMLWIFRYPR